MPLHLTTQFTDNIYLLHCDGAIVLGAEATALETLLDRCSHATSKIILNLANVPRLDSMGLGLIVRHMATLRKRGGDLRLSAPSPFVTSLLHHTLLATVLQSFPTDQDALNSFHRAPSTPQPHAVTGRRILLIDSSPDLCAFVRYVLSQHGFDVRSIGLLRDAKILLNSQAADYLLIGPSNPHLTPDILRQNLGSVAPRNAPRHLPPRLQNHRRPPGRRHPPPPLRPHPRAPGMNLGPIPRLERPRLRPRLEKRETSPPS